MPAAWHETLRAKFPALRSLTYLNTAAAGPLPFAVARAGCLVYESLLQGGDRDWEQHLALMEAARASLARLAGADPVEIAFTRNTSHSANLVAQMLWDAGARTAVALEDEFPSSTLPFLNRGFDLRFVAPVDGRYRLEDLDAALAGRDVLVASQVVYRTGFALDSAALGRLAAARGAHLVLCATQALGALRVDFHASGAAFCIGTSHKWLCAGYGGGWLAMRKDLIGALRWPAVGWLSAREPERMRNDVLDLAPAARVLEMGCQASPAVLAVGAASELWLSTGPERVEARVRALTRELRARLAAEGLDFPDRTDAELSGITIVPVPDPEAVCRALQAEGISTTPRGGGVRVALHAFNDGSDLDRLVDALVRPRDL
jgi:selenocysteine lyase/cysteine desulfurase